jgi:alpha-ketoglutarate-dependent taurine dioxygenase
MNITYPNGTWPCYIEGVDVKNLTNEQVQFIGQAKIKNTLVVIKGQNLTVDDEVAFGNRFGVVAKYERKNTTGIPDEAFEKFYDADHRDSPYLNSVTGAKNKDGLPGLHGMKEDLDWHCGQPWNQRRPDIVYLYSVKGSVGSRTSYINSAEAYKDLSDEWKQRIANLTIRPMKGYSNYSKTGEHFGIPPYENPNYHPPVTAVNKAGVKTLFLPFFQMAGFHEWLGTEQQEQDMIAYLRDHMTQEKYIYHHHWNDGDIVAHDNWNGLHKRWYFEDMENRLLHRMQYNLETIKF